MIVRLCGAAAYIVVAGHEEQSRDDHCQRMLEMAKVRVIVPLPSTIKMLQQQYAGDSQGAGCAGLVKGAPRERVTNVRRQGQRQRRGRRLSPCTKPALARDRHRRRAFVLAPQ